MVSKAQDLKLAEPCMSLLGVGGRKDILLHALNDLDRGMFLDILSRELWSKRMGLQACSHCSESRLFTDVLDQIASTNLYWLDREKVSSPG